jgi:chromate reductase, NAD(P)H dehydrogenase (quinone)
VPATKTVSVLIGSLRRDSINRRLYDAARLVAPSDLSLLEAPIGQLPLYNADLELQSQPAPAEVQVMRDRIAAADGLLIFTPEYNYSIPGVLKNAFDWLWQPGDSGVLNGKPGAMLGASVGRSGTMRAQLHLRNVLVSLGAICLTKPEIFVTFAGDKFDRDGRLTDRDTEEQLRTLIVAFSAWIDRAST